MNVQVLSFTVVLLTACRLLHVNFYCFIFWSLTFSQCAVLLTESCSMTISSEVILKEDSLRHDKKQLSSYCIISL